MEPPKSDKDISTPEVSVTTTGEQAAQPPRWKGLVYVPLVFLYLFSNNIISIPLTDLLMTRICSTKFNYSAEVCDNIKNYTDIEDKVQIQSTLILLYSSIIKIFPSACLSVFVGPWSDKYGRKLPMYISIIGSMLYDIVIVIYGAYPTAPVYILYLASIPNGLTGAAVTFLGCAYSLAADKTDHVTRTRNYAFMQIATATGAPLGGLVSGFLYNAGSVPVFGLGLATHFATLVFIFFFIKDDSVRVKASFKTKMVDFFSLDNLKENARVLTKKRENKQTAQIVLVTFSSAIIYLNFASIPDVMFPFCKKMYSWSVTKYSSVVTIYAISSMAVLIVAIPLLLRVFKMTDAWIGTIGTFCFAAEHFVKGFAYYPWIFYLSLAVGVGSGMASFAARARISKTVQDDELGCVFAAVSSLENVAPIIGSPLFTGVYNGSISFYPGLVFLVAAATLLFPFFVFLWLTRLPNVSHKKLVEEEEQTSREETDRSMQAMAS